MIVDTIDCDTIACTHYLPAQSQKNINCKIYIRMLFVTAYSSNMSYASQNYILSIVVIAILLNSNTTCVPRTPLCISFASVDIPRTAVALSPGQVGCLTR